MSEFATMTLPERPDVTAPDGSAVRILLSLKGGSMAHFELPAGEVSRGVVHRTVEEIWFVTGGRGRMWRRSERAEDETELGPGVCVTIPQGTAFQFRSDGPQPLSAVAITMPPWPGAEEAVVVEGHWRPTCPPSPD